MSTYRPRRACSGRQGCSLVYHLFVEEHAPDAFLVVHRDVTAYSVSLAAGGQRVERILIPPRLCVVGIRYVGDIHDDAVRYSRKVVVGAHDRDIVRLITRHDRLPQLLESLYNVSVLEEGYVTVIFFLDLDVAVIYGVVQ